jgi:hypothetical protein
MFVTHAAGGSLMAALQLDTLHVCYHFDTVQSISLQQRR